MNPIQVIDIGSDGSELSLQEHDIIKAIEFQEQTAQQLVDLLDILGMDRLKNSFIAWYEISKPLKYKSYLEDIAYIMQDIKKSGAIEQNYKIQVRAQRDAIALKVQGMQQHELISIEQPISLIDNVESVLRSLNRSIVAYLDAINGTYLGFHIDQVIDTYGDLVYHINWKTEEELIRFFNLIKEDVQVSIITTLATKTTDLEIWTLQESNTIESILPMIKDAIVAYLSPGFKQKFDGQTKKQVIQDIALLLPVLIERYPLAKNTKYLYSTASSIENAITENLPHIIADAANNVISKALSLGELNKNVFLGNIIFLLTYGFSLQGQISYTEYIVAYLKAKKNDLMAAEQSTRTAYERNKQHQVQKEKPIKPSVEVVTVKVEKPLVAIEQAGLLQTVISQLCLDNADSEDEIFFYIQRMISSQKDIRLSSWMKSKNIFVDTKETWEDFIVMIKNIDQIANYWIDEGCEPIRTKENNNWRHKQKFDPKVEAKKDMLMDKLEEQYKTKKVLDLMADLRIEVPHAQIKKLQDKFESLQPHYQNALKRVLHEAKVHPQLIHDKRKYRVLKFGRKYRLVLEKDMKVKDYGIYVYGEDYNKLWPDMVHNNP